MGGVLYKEPDSLFTTSSLLPSRELKMSNEKFISPGSSSSPSASVIEVASSTEQPSAFQRFKDSFKPYEYDKDEEINPNLSEVEKAAIATAKSPLTRSLQGRHLQMISIGGAIGTGLFVGSGSALSTGGPAAVLIGWIIVGFMMYCTVHALGELAVTFPVAGSFLTYNTRFVSPSWGFTMSWNYAMSWLISLPSELVAASICIQYWNTDINPAAWVAIFYVLIISINFFGVKGYGEGEFIFSIIKVLAIVGFIILGIVLCVGGGPTGGYIGGKYWHDPGAFANGFKGVCSVFISAAYSFGGTELCGLAAAETANPRKTLPRATKQVFWRITLFYIVSLTLVGLLVPYDSPRLLNASSDASASPFVIAITNAGISGLPSVFNVVIMISVLSVGNSAVFGASRTLAAIAAQGHAPKIVGYIDRSGRPLVGIIITCVIGLLCFLASYKNEDTIFTWLYSICGLSGFFTWGAICFCHIRFRRALKAQGRSTDELTFTSHVGVWGSIAGVVLVILVLIAQFWLALWPIGGSPNASDFFETYLTAPVLIAFYLFHSIWKRDFTVFIRAKDIDIDTGRRETDLDLVKQEIAEEKEYIKTKPLYYRAYRFWC